MSREEMNEELSTNEERCYWRNWTIAGNVRKT